MKPLDSTQVALLEDLAKPDGLSPLGAQAWRLIVQNLVGMKLTFTGGCRAFYSPKAWRERREEYCLGAVLIVVFDGGDLGAVFAAERAHRAHFDAMDRALRAAGFHVEQGTHWYAGVYTDGQRTGRCGRCGQMDLALRPDGFPVLHDDRSGNSCHTRMLGCAQTDEGCARHLRDSGIRTESDLRTWARRVGLLPSQREG